MIDRIKLILGLKVDCEFAGTCSGYQEDSHVCTHGGGEYCGLYRKQKEAIK